MRVVTPSAKVLVLQRKCNLDWSVGIGGSEFVKHTTLSTLSVPSLALHRIPTRLQNRKRTISNLPDPRYPASYITNHLCHETPKHTFSPSPQHNRTPIPKTHHPPSICATPPCINQRRTSPSKRTYPQIQTRTTPLHATLSHHIECVSTSGSKITSERYLPVHNVPRPGTLSCPWNMIRTCASERAIPRCKACEMQNKLLQRRAKDGRDAPM